MTATDQLGPSNLSDLLVAAVLFDCDGVLVDSETLSAIVLTAMLADRGVGMAQPTALELLRGRQVASWIAELFGAHSLAGGQPDFVQEALRDRVSAAYPDQLRPEPYAQELLGELGLPYSIVSNAPRWKIHEGLTCAGLDGSAAHELVSAYELGSWKPEPTVYLTAAAGLGLPPARCLAVEDSDAGIRAAHAAGMPVVHYCRDDAVPTHPLATVRSRNHRQTRHITVQFATRGAAV